ncbi:MAG: hypothetical protein M1833_003641 [Piccolia ochrophora]|nr:MAG: hypothetical protein M1833_003641 [Piccolia ochrophora]
MPAPGPPPQEFLPPPGPPPGYSNPESSLAHGSSAPQDAAVPYHDWTAIPDTALLPPPPALGYETSPTSNASEHNASTARAWCEANALWPPRSLSSKEVTRARDGVVRLVPPKEFKGSLTEQARGVWKVQSRPSCQDACFLTDVPLYSVLNDSPVRTGMRKAIHLEARLLSLGHSGESALSLGFCAQPYPTWRLPGWQRGSLGIHGDDGRRFVNDMWGGKDFTEPFRVGETIRVDMTFALPNEPPEYSVGEPARMATMQVDVSLGRDGRSCGGWSIHEELDLKEDLGVQGLEGDFDVYGAIGVFGEVEFVASFS